MVKEKLLEKHLVTEKTFSYQKEGVSLKFTLEVDNSSQLRKFKDLLEVALTDIDEELEGMKN